MIRNKKKNLKSGTTPSSEAAKSETSDSHDDPKLSSVQPDVVSDTPFGQFCSSSIVDEPDDVDDTSSG